MRLAIISDIHSNLPGLEAVLAAIDEIGVDERWCLGDVVGYGAQPDECTALVAERCDLCIVGNHDLAVLGELDTEVFSPAAAAAAEWTRETCKAATLDFLRGRSASDAERDPALYHASPRDPIWEYVLSTDQAADCMGVQSRRVALIGHSHVALWFRGPEPYAGPGSTDEVTGELAPGGRQLDLSEDRWLVNPGSAGQPRDGDPRAAWLELDTEDWSATYHRVEYDIDAAAAPIRAAGLPEHLAERLYIGQ